MKYIGIDARMFSVQSTGIGRYLYEVLSGVLDLVKANSEDISFLIFIDPSYIGEDIFIKHSDRVILVPCRFQHYSMESFFKFAGFIRSSFEIDLMHFPHFNVPFGYEGKYIMTIHDLIHHRYPPKLWYKKWKHIFYRFAFRTAVRRAGKIISVSNATRSDLLAYYPFLSADKVQTIYEGGPDLGRDNFSDEDVRHVFDRYGVENQKYLFYLGRHGDHKNLKILIESAGDLKSRGLKIVIGGKIYRDTDNLLNLVRELGAANVIFTDFISDKDAAILFKHTLAYVQPSFIEGFGLPSLEAFSYGAPCILSDIPCHREVAGDSVLFFDPASVSSLVTQVDLFLLTPGLRDKYVSVGRSCLSAYSWKRAAQETLDLYKKML